MALRFRTPHIEELPTTQTKQAPGFAWVAVPAAVDAAVDLTSKKRGSRISALGQTEAQREAHSVRQQEKINARIRELNSDNARAGSVLVPKKDGGKGKTSNTRKILGSMKHFSHYVDDEEADFALTGRVDGMERAGEAGQLRTLPVPAPTQRSSKTPYARRVQQEQSAAAASPLPVTPIASEPALDLGEDSETDTISTAPALTQADVDLLLSAPPLLYNAARSAPPPPSAPPPRTFCEICGYWGRVRCLKCGARTCSVDCETIHVADRCLKFYA